MGIAIKIIGLVLADRGPWDNGDKPLAWFDCEVSGLRLNGCTLIRAARGFLIAQPPKADCQRQGARAVQIVDPELRSYLADAAYKVFQSFGGAE
jgi:hypothetical protein